MDQRSNVFLFLKELLGTDVFGREMGSEGGPELARSLQAKSILCKNFKLGVREQ